MSENMNVIGFIITTILFLMVVLGVEKKYIHTNFKTERYPSENIGYSISASESFVSDNSVQGQVENLNILSDFCNPKSLTFCAMPKPFKYEIDKEIENSPNRLWNPSSKKNIQGPMGVGLQAIPQIAMPSD